MRIASRPARTTSCCWPPDSLAGSRWTYTARGSLVNVAARIGAMAKGGQTFLSKTTAERVMRQIDLKKVGDFSFKNVNDKVTVYQLP